MPLNNGSLLLAEQEDEQREADQTLFLFHGEIPKIDRDQPKFHCTGEYLFNNRRDIYKAACSMLVEPGISIRQICRTLHVSHNTLSSIEEREAPTLTHRKKVILGTITRALRCSAERVEELAPEMTPRDATIAVGVLTEKMQLLGGESTLIIGVKPGGNIFERFQAYHDETIKVIRAHVIEPGMDCEWKDAEQKALCEPMPASHVGASEEGEGI